jgi:hypothetical protein
MTRALRRTAVAVLAMIGLAAAAGPAAADPVPTFDFADCPAIPAGADPAQWRCEVLMSTGTVRFGNLPGQSTGPMRLTFAEGQLDGKFAQVFGALRAEPTRVVGVHPLPRMDMRIEYAGFADFLSVGDQMGEQHLKIRLINRFLPNSCTIGSDEDPIRFRPIRTSGPDVISTNPTVLRFTIEDKEFAVPRTRGCGGLNRLLDKRFGLPAASGTNTFALTTMVGLKSYTEI